MAPPKLYMVDVSPPVRTVLLTAKAIGITLEHKEIYYSKPEQFAPAFLKLNPQTAVPTLVDNGYIIWDSHAIIAYLIGKYANDDTLYPRDHLQRTIIDERLHFDSEVVFANISCIVRHMIKCGIKTIPRDAIENLKEAYDFLEESLEDHQWMAGDTVTIADLSLIPSVTSADILLPIDNVKYPKISAWLKRSQALPYYQEANQVGLDNFKNLIKNLQM